MPLISPNFDVKSIIFPNFGKGLFPKLLEKALIRHGKLDKQVNYVMKFDYKVCSNRNINSVSSHKFSLNTWMLLAKQI